MSFLTPLYILGLAAVVAPIIFHLIRRSPKGEVPFSSLMFLSPTPPRLTRRSRLDNWLLLLLRAAALSLLAFAFARPFLRQAAHLDFGDVRAAPDRPLDRHQREHAPRRPVAAGPGTGRPGARRMPAHRSTGGVSPSMRPPGLCSAFMNRRRSIRRGVKPSPGHILDRLAPTWSGTNLGQALVDTVAAIEDVADTSEKTARMPRRVVLISDLAQGSRLDALGDFEWPSDVELDLKTVADTGSNAGLERLADQTEAEPGECRHVPPRPGCQQPGFRAREVRADLER